MPSGNCPVTVVLLCMGRGGDPHSFRPSRDESQYWCRRDALVRCVTSFLWGPGCPRTCDRELIVLFDDDLACSYLTAVSTVDGRENIVPTEQAILSVFKMAAQSLTESVTKHGLTCRTEMDASVARLLSQKTNHGSTRLPSGLDSKRQVLEFLQTTCSMDFLRNNGLNSSTEVILRKCNKKLLVEKWAKWQKEQVKNGSVETKSSTDAELIESLFHRMISTFQQQSNDDVSVVGTLHESCEEFPCFEEQSFDIDDDSSTSYRTMLFLGAVRDMTSQENEILDKVCCQLRVARIGIRFGSVPEFTSKILSILAFHQLHRDSMKRALKRLLDTTKGKRDTPLLDLDRRPATSLHVVCIVPCRSAEVLPELAKRECIHWCLVRVVVSTLWRSKLVSSGNSVNHTNTLTLVFDDGVTLYLQEDVFVAKLASQHQAAPSEYQILNALRALLDMKEPLDDGWSKKELASKVISSIVESSSEVITSTISIIKGEGNTRQLSQPFFQTRLSGKKDGLNVDPCKSALVVMDINKRISSGSTNKHSKMLRAILSAASKQQISCISTSVVDNVLDFEASSITCVQHFLYQNRLFLTPSNNLAGKKRKAQ